MAIVSNLALGFGVAFTPTNLFYCLIGATLGTLVGVLPGLSPIIAITMLLPLTFKIAATPAVIMLAGIYYGAHHAGSTTAIMLNMPGEPSSIVICFDGHPMARQGRAGSALCVSALGSFFAGCVSVLVIALFSPPLARAALSFQAPEYAATIVLALCAVSALSSHSIVTTLGMAAIGLLLGTVGTDINSGTVRFAFGQDQLSDGIDFVAVAVGMFAIAEIGYRLGVGERAGTIGSRVRGLLPTKAELKASVMPVLRGTGIGGAFGILPGTGPLISSFASYALEKRLAGDPSRFGKGAIEGVAGPEAANNAAAFTHFIPMLTLGIPAGATMALMLGALLIQGISPGPQILTQHPDLFWGLVASMWVGNLMLLVLNLPMVGIWIRILAIPYRLLYPMILVFCCVGVYSVNNAAYDVAFAAVIGAFGYFCRRIKCDAAPLVLGLVLGPVLEVNFRRSLLISRGDVSVFFTRPISVSLLILAAVIILAFSFPGLKPRLVKS